MQKKQVDLGMQRENDEFRFGHEFLGGHIGNPYGLSRRY